MNLSQQRIVITGGSGFLGRQILAQFAHRKYLNYYAPPHNQYDLTNLEDIQRMLRNYRPTVVIHAAAQAGGIGLNQNKPGELFYNNAIMGIQLMEQARLAGVKKYVQIGTVCEYPKYTPVPFKEEDLWGGYPEETNAPYGLAKKMLLVQGIAYRRQYDFRSVHVLPVNMYGPGDHFDLNTSHVIPALIRKISEAKQNDTPVTIWGDGSASREFLYVEDCAEAIVLATERYDGAEPVNIGVGSEITIKNLVSLIADLLDFHGEIIYDTTKPNGQPRRCLDTTRAWEKFGFKASTTLEDGLKKTIKWYQENL